MSVVQTLTLSRRILPGIAFSLLAIYNPLPSHLLIFSSANVPFCSISWECSIQWVTVEGLGTIRREKWCWCIIGRNSWLAPMMAVLSWTHDTSYMLPHLCSILNSLYSWTTLFLNYSILELLNSWAALSEESSILEILLKPETKVYNSGIMGLNEFSSQGSNYHSYIVLLCHRNR
jgi:hypothetical protein